MSRDGTSPYQERRGILTCRGAQRTRHRYPSRASPLERPFGPPEHVRSLLIMDSFALAPDVGKGKVAGATADLPARRIEVMGDQPNIFPGDTRTCIIRNLASMHRHS
jgi:hypothetical protein